eukprot:TRINITY_DN8641_c0_g1_i2.p1 TRINITY_DN8641_c0_g1~~TRINITY_DN8641_c0_g1_i2.p1  ORF type:complete len:109 (-),score=13.84 TRINITY_DN8641_c0_g1_i2:798-1097(-)
MPDLKAGDLVEYRNHYFYFKPLATSCYLFHEKGRANTEKVFSPAKKSVRLVSPDVVMSSHEISSKNEEGKNCKDFSCRSSTPGKKRSPLYFCLRSSRRA